MKKKTKACLKGSLQVMRLDPVNFFCRCPFARNQHRNSNGSGTRATRGGSQARLKEVSEVHVLSGAAKKVVRLDPHNLQRNRDGMEHAPLPSEEGTT